MTVATAAMGRQVIGYRMQITLSQGTLLLSTIPHYGSGNEQYHAMTVAVPPVAYDHEGITRFGFTIEQRGPYRIGSASHATLNDALKVNPPLNRPVTLIAIVETGEGTVTQQLCAGRIDRITDITPTTISFECEQRTKLAQTVVPRNRIEKVLFSDATLKKRIPAESDGESMPVAFGRFLSHVPHNLFSAVTLNRIQQVLGLWYPPALSRAVPLQTASSAGADRSVYAINEYVNSPRHVFMDMAQNNPSIDAFLYLPQVNSYGRVWEQTSEDGLSVLASPFQNVAYAVEVGKQPYVRAGITAAKFVPSESTGTITNPEYAIDGRMENYCVLGVGARACWEVRIATGVGRLSMNTSDAGTAGFQDWEGVNRPAGLGGAALLAFPNNDFVPTSGTVSIGLKYPGSTTTVAFGTSDYTILQLGTAGMLVGGVAQIVRFCAVARSSDGRTGEYDDGWAGTKWERGDFSAGGSDDGPDKAIYLAGNRDTRPMRVAIHNNTNKTIAVSKAGMLCAFKLESERTMNRSLKEAQERARKLAEIERIKKKAPSGTFGAFK